MKVLSMPCDITSCVTTFRTSMAYSKPVRIVATALSRRI